MQDHVHIFAGIHPTQSIATLMQVVKGESSEWINQKKLSRNKFRWQEGYAAFTYAKSQVRTVYDYVLNQKEHHQTKTFLQEYTQFLDAFDVEYDMKYIFSPPA